jgi:hypothetical protein
VDPLIETEMRRFETGLRESWRGRVLDGAKGATQDVVLSIMAHNYAGAILTLCQVVWPGFIGLESGFVSAGKIDKSGRVVADYGNKNGTITKDMVVYRSDIAYRDAMRRLADRVKLDDQERLEFFTCVKRWLVADRRLDPSMDYADPDAKRLSH